MHGWRGVHAWCVRVERALHARARVHGAGQRAWVTHARRRLGKPGARRATPAGKKGKRAKWLTSYFCPEGKKNAAPPILAPRVWSLLPVSLPNRCAVHNRAASAAACLRCSCHTIEPSTDMGKNAHIRVPIYQQQQALRVAAKQFVNHVSSLPDEGAASSSPSTCAGFPATSPKTPRATSPATPTGTATFAISDPTWTWRPSSSHLQPTWAPQPESKCGAGLQRALMEDPGPASLEAPPIATRHNAASITRRPSSPHAQPTWAPQPERKCGGHGGDDDNPIAAAASEDPKRALVHALQNDLSRMLVQLERLDEMLSA